MSFDIRIEMHEISFPLLGILKILQYTVRLEIL